GRPRLSLTTRPAPVGYDGESKAQPVVELCEALREGKPFEGGVAVYARLDDEAKRLRRAVDEHLAGKPGPKSTKVVVTTEGLKPLKHHADDRGFPHFYKDTYVLSRGDVNKKQGVATQGFLQVLERGADESRWVAPPQAGSRTPGRRTALAKWLTNVD